jgi:hypothetical protein
MPHLHSVQPRAGSPPSLAERRYHKLHRGMGWFELKRGHWEFDTYWSRFVLPWRWSRFEISLTIGPLMLHLFRRRAPEEPEPEEYRRLRAIDGSERK